jgi:hypothetical protein
MKLQPYNAEHPFERAADQIRKDIAELATRAMESKDYKALSAIEQVQCFMAGAMTAVIGVCFAHVEDAGRDAIMEAIEEYLPQARVKAEGIIESAGLQ